MNKIKYFPEKNYIEIIDSVGSLNYCIFEKKETVPGNIFPRQMAIQNYNSIVAGTGCTVTDYTIEFIGSKEKKEEVIIPAGGEVIVVRLLRYDDRHGLPHYNADDQIIFPTKKGDILRLPRNDAPDHYIKIAETSRIKNVADAYRLPEEKSGPVEKYSAKGAKLHIDLLPK